MTVTAESIVTEALSLAPHARAFIAERLIESLDATAAEDISPAWREEIRKRCREVDQGAVELRSAEDVFVKAYAALS